ncbi:MAG: HNH endonuclease signature motif containing protein [Pirellulales bacterium]
MDTADFLKQFQDYLAPKLDVYEQSIYLYIFRHSRLIDRQEVVLGFKSARLRMALGVGKVGTPISDNRCYKALRSLERKGCLKTLSTERTGTRIELKLPCEIIGIIPNEIGPVPIDLETMDFFEVLENRQLILERDGKKCFYCIRSLNAENYVIEHVVSRPLGNNGYRNVVAACRNCNNRKGKTTADDFLRTLYRDGYLGSGELEDRVFHLQRLCKGELVPQL